MAYSSHPATSRSMPRTGNALTSAIGSAILKAIGWKIVGALPEEKKLIIIGGPHTSNMDFILAMGSMLSLNLKFSYMMKREAFRFPVASLFKWLGGVPIDRRAAKDVTTQMVDWFNENDNVWLGITPEGTRSKVKEFKKGYLRIAYAASVPVFMVGINTPAKEVVLDKVMPLTGDIDADNAAIREYMMSTYQGIRRRPPGA